MYQLFVFCHTPDIEVHVITDWIQPIYSLVTLTFQGFILFTEPVRWWTQVVFSYRSVLINRITNACEGVVQRGRVKLQNIWFFNCHLIDI